MKNLLTDLETSSSKKMHSEKLPYSSPKVTFIPVKFDEKSAQKAQKRGAFTVPIGCC